METEQELLTAKPDTSSNAMNRSRSERWLMLAMILSMCIWGVSWSSAKVLAAYGSAPAMAFLRFTIVPLTLFPLLSLMKVKLGIQKQGIPYLAGAGLLMGVYTIVFFQALQVGLSGAGGVLVTTLNPIFSYIVGLVISRTLPKKAELLGLLLGMLAGIVLLKLWSNLDALFVSGNSLFLLAAFIWAVMSKITAQAHRFGSPLSFSMWMHLMVVAGLAFVTDLPEVINILETGDALFWFNIIYFGTVNSAVATTVYLYATSKLGAERASSFIFIVPFAAVLSSWLFLGEAILWHTVVGGILGVLAVLVINGKWRFGNRLAQNPKTA